jgi:gas vesicle protein
VSQEPAKVARCCKGGIENYIINKKEVGMKEGGSCGVCSAASAFFLGGLLGGGIALLFAPASGRETRQQITGFAEGVKDKGADYYDQIRQTVTSALADGKGLIDEKKRLITKAVQAGIEAYEKEKKET